MTSPLPRTDSLSPGRLGLIERILKQKGIRLPEAQVIPRRVNFSPCPASFAQQRLWFLYRLEPDSSFYNVCMNIPLNGQFKIRALENSLNEVLRRHEVLRTTFAIRDGQPVQIIAPTSSLTLPIIDLMGLPKNERWSRAWQITTELFRLPFDLEAGPVLRIALLQLDQKERLILLAMHHIVCDAWSKEILVEELLTLYKAYSSGRSSPLEELPIQYADYAIWQREWLRGEVLEAQL